ncbi:MAG: hypothetical protein RIT32_662 [Actinomycetota bacterium]
MKVVRSLTDIAELPSTSPRVFVPTMGALHDGHGELVRVARVEAGKTGIVIVSVFVNPLQFGANEDFNKYPRTEESDITLAAKFGADVIWFPEATELLSAELVQLISPDFGNQLEGRLRPGHFDGVLTIVNRFFELLEPNKAIFGVKDLQQLILIRDMAKQRHPSIEIIAVETVRAANGLALSSRNKYLSAAELAKADAINQALNIAALQSDPVSSFKTNLAGAGFAMEAIDYAEVIDMPNSCLDLGKQRLVVAVRIGSTRLLDNIALN